MTETDTPHSDEQRSYWDANLDTRNLSSEQSTLPDLDEEIGFLSSPEYEHARRELGSLDGRVVVDIGCGMGVNALAMARDGARVVAMDLSGERLRALRQWAKAEGLAERILLVQGAIENAPLADESLDAAFTKSVLIHTRLDRAGEEIARMLKPSGRGVFVEPASGNPFVALYRRFLGPRIWQDIAVYFNAERWRLLAKSFHGDVTDVDRAPFFLLGFLAFRWQFSRRDLERFRKSLALWGRVDGALFRIAPVLKRLRWMDVATLQKKGKT